MFKSRDFVRWGYTASFHRPAGAPLIMWECPDFYPLAGGLHVLKASVDTDPATPGQRNWWAVGRYTEVADDARPDTLAVVSAAELGARLQQDDYSTAPFTPARRSTTRPTAGARAHWLDRLSLRRHGLGGRADVPVRCADPADPADPARLVPLPPAAAPGLLLGPSTYSCV
jgi:hypothetical protein